LETMSQQAPSELSYQPNVEEHGDDISKYEMPGSADELPSRARDPNEKKYSTFDSFNEEGEVDDTLMNAIMSRGTAPISDSSGEGEQKQMPIMNSDSKIKQNKTDILALAKQMEKGR